MVNLRPIYVRAGTGPRIPPTPAAWQALWNSPVLQLDEPGTLPADSPKGEFLISQTVLRYASIDVDLI